MKYLWPKETRDWDRYYENVDQDAPHQDIIELVKHLKAAGMTIILLTGRREETREATEFWLKQYEVPYDALIMRPPGNKTDDQIWKLEIVDIIGKHNILLALEDRDRIVRAMRLAGIRVLQVADGNF